LAEALAARHRLPRRHFETALQSLVRDGILEGICGRRGSYALARERNRITAGDILRAAMAAANIDELPLLSSRLSMTCSGRRLPIPNGQSLSHLVDTDQAH